MRWPGYAAVAALAVAGVLAASTGRFEPAAFEPTIEWTSCPSDVEATFLARHECGYLTVLEDRSEPRGRTLRLLAVKVWPVGVQPRPGLFTSVGNNVGDPQTVLGSASTGATRLAQVGVNLEPRGTGSHGTVELVCHEIDELDARATALAGRDPGLLTDFVAAVAACHDRFTAQGVDVARYGAADHAADVDDLRRALAIDRWAVMGSYGSSSRTLFEYVRLYPHNVAAAYMDSPLLPGPGVATGALAGFGPALETFLAGCEAEPACAGKDLRQAWRTALATTRAEPLRAAPAAGAPKVVVDDVSLARAVGFVLGGDGPGDLTALPEMIEAAARGQVSADLARILRDTPVYCAGYRPVCIGQDGFAHGVFLTGLCQDLPKHDTAFRTATTSSRTHHDVFATDPWVSACAQWPVLPSDAASTAPVRTDVPMLMLSGALDSFSPAAPLRALAADNPRMWTVEVPGQTHNVLGFSQCALDVRNAWVRATSRAPASLSCAGY